MLNLLVTLQLFGHSLKDRVTDEDGAIAIEYALMALVIALGLLAASQSVRTALQTMLSRIVTGAGTVTSS